MGLKKIKAGQSGNGDTNKDIRNHRFYVCLSDDEYQLTTNKARQSGFNTLAAFARHSLIKSKAKRDKATANIKIPHKLLLNLSMIGGNINQIAHQINSQNLIAETKGLPPPIVSKQITLQLEAIKQVLGKLSEQLLKKQV